MEIALSGAQDIGDFKVRALPSESFKDGLNLAFLLRVLWPQATAALHSEVNALLRFGSGLRSDDSIKSFPFISQELGIPQGVHRALKAVNKYICIYGLLKRKQKN